MSTAATDAAKNDPAYIASQAQQQMEAKKQTALLSASSLTGADKVKALVDAGLVDEAKSASSNLPSVSVSSPLGSVVNVGGTPVQVSGVRLERNPRWKLGQVGFYNNVVYGKNLITGEVVKVLEQEA